MTTFTDRIQVIIDAATGGFVRGTQDAADHSTRFGNATKFADDRLDAMGLTGVRTGDLLKAGLAAGATAAGAAVLKFGQDSVDAFVDGAGAVREFQRASGASAEESSRFVAVLDDMNVSSETGAKALFKLGREVGQGTEPLREYGIEVAKNRDGTVNLTETLLNVADAYKSTADQGERNAMIQAAFGRAGKELIPILEQGRDGLREFFDSAKSDNQIFTQEQLDRAREYELAVDELNDAMAGLQRSVGEALLPTLTQTASTGADFIRTTDQMSESVGGIAGMLSFANDNFNPLMFGISGASGAMKILSGDFRDGAQEMTGMLGPVGTGIEKVGQLTGIFGKGGEETDRYTEAQKRLKDAQLAVVKASDEEGRKSGELREARRELQKATEEFESVQGRVIKNLETEEDRQSRVIAKEQERRLSVLGLSDSSLTLESKQIDLTQAMDDYRQKVEAGTLSELDRREEEVRLERQIRETAEAAYEHAVATSTATTEAGKAKEGTAAYDATLKFLAGTLAPNDPLRRRIDELIFKLGEASAPRQGKVDVDTGPAHRNLDDLERRLDFITSRRYQAQVDATWRSGSGPWGGSGERYGE